jgi:hypothetical protein
MIDANCNGPGPYRRSDFRLEPKRMPLVSILRRIHVLAGAAAALALVLSVAAPAQPRIQVAACGIGAALAQMASNPAYRLQVYSKATPQLLATQDWTLRYRFFVPPLPTSPTWDYRRGTVYQWGDVDFDSYGSGGTYKLSDYLYNQIVPELVLGSVLDANDADYKPSWSQVSTWRIEAQYYWHKATTSTSYAQTGSVVKVNPGDEITTTIQYTTGTGTIVASIVDNNISGPSGASSITIARPFPNDPSLFKSWADFFKKAVAASRTSYILSEPVLDVETDYLDQQTVCGLLPFALSEISIPGVDSNPSAFAIQQPNGFTCGQPLVALRFSAAK